MESVSEADPQPAAILAVARGFQTERRPLLHQALLLADSGYNQALTKQQSRALAPCVSRCPTDDQGITFAVPGIELRWRCDDSRLVRWPHPRHAAGLRQRH